MAAHSTPGAPPSEPIDGPWGGDRLQLVIDGAGGRVQADCASGSFNGPITLNAQGSFTATGVYEAYKSGPQRADEDAVKAKAHYTGDIKGGEMKLSILPEGASAPQVFKLRKGATIKLIHCL